MNDPARADPRSRRPIATSVVFAAIIVTLAVATRVITPPTTSSSERRPLATFPPLTAQTLVDAEFMGAFEDYAADSFAFREAWRALHAVTVFGPYLQLDKSGLYLGATGAGRIEPLDEASVARSAAKLAQAAATLPQGTRTFYAAIPDKSYYAGRFYPGYDPAQAAEILAQNLPGLTAIDLTGALDAQDFYTTDLHWDQPELGGVLAALGDALGFAPPKLADPVAAGGFQGVYPGQLALPLPDDTMRYVPLSDSVTARYLDPRTLAWRDGPVYDLTDQGFAGRDPYDLFLQGAQAVVTLSNPAAPESRTLYCFRDSFGSALAPLLAEAYQHVVLIDLRYIDLRLLPAHVTFVPGSDALFLVSSQVLDNPSVLLVT